MNYPIPSGSIVEVRITGTLFNQRTINVFHYLAPGGTATNGDMELLLSAFEAGPYESFVSTVTTDWVGGRIQGQVISPTRQIALNFLPEDTAGTVEGTTLPGNNAAVLVRKTLTAGRTQQGRIFMPAMPSTWVTNGVINSTGLVAYAVMAGQLDATLDVDGRIFQPIIVGYVKPPGSPGSYVNRGVVQVFEVNPVVRSQRRREIGVGQ